MTQVLPIKTLSEKLDATAPTLKGLDAYWSGSQPMSFLSPDSLRALGDRMPKLSINIPRLGLMSLVERMQLRGVKRDGVLDQGLWKLWKQQHMIEETPQAILDALIYGRSFFTVWATAPGRPVVTIESPRHMAVQRDPITREVTAALKRWVQDGKGCAVMYLPTQILKMSHDQGATITDLDSMPQDGWIVTERITNPLGVVPVVPLVNRGRLADVDGVSEMQDVLALTDALNKIMADAMVTSEKYARPRRWATGLEIVEDEDGHAINPFSETSQLWQAEDADVKFGQFDPASLDGYQSLIDALTKQIGALLSLPPHYLGMNGDQPPSADSIRSAEASLVSRVIQLHRSFGAAFARVFKLIVAVRDGVDVDDVDIEVMWANPETRTPMQAADAALKIVQVDPRLLPYVMHDILGLLPEEAQKIISTPRPDDDKGLSARQTPRPSITEGK